MPIGKKLNYMSKAKTILSWVLRIVSAVILLQTLFFKFTAAPESVYIFSKIGLEPFGRIGIGVGELIASVLILLNPTKILGALLAIGLMSGAIFFHLTVLGVVVMNDGGLLLTYAALVWIASSTVVILHRNELTMMLTQIRNLIKPDKSKSL